MPRKVRARIGWVGLSAVTRRIRKLLPLAAGVLAKGGYYRRMRRHQLCSNALSAAKITGNIASTLLMGNTTWLCAK